MTRRQWDHDKSYLRNLLAVRCLHPSYLWTPCQLTWWNGIYGWWTRCTRCGYTKACTP